jgi:hypothetical protein
MLVSGIIGRKIQFAEATIQVWKFRATSRYSTGVKGHKQVNFHCYIVTAHSEVQKCQNYANLPSSAMHNDGIKKH